MLNAELKNFDRLTGWYESKGCPKHGSRVRKIYRFGRFEDAHVVTFNGCSCAVCINNAALIVSQPQGHEYTYHTSYLSAAARAELIKAKEAIDNAPLMSGGW